MQTLIIHPNQFGPGIAILTPVIDCGIPLEEIARKDVPPGVPYKFIKNTDLPKDYHFAAAWDADFSNPDGYGVGPDAWFNEQESKK